MRPAYITRKPSRIRRACFFFSFTASAPLLPRALRLRSRTHCRPLARGAAERRPSDDPPKQVVSWFVPAAPSGIPAQESAGGNIGTNSEAGQELSAQRSPLYEAHTACTTHPGHDMTSCGAFLRPLPREATRTRAAPRANPHDAWTPRTAANPARRTTRSPSFTERTDDRPPASLCAHERPGAPVRRCGLGLRCS